MSDGNELVSERGSAVSLIFCTLPDPRRLPAGCSLENQDQLEIKGPGIKRGLCLFCINWNHRISPVGRNLT